MHVSFARLHELAEFLRIQFAAEIQTFALENVVGIHLRARIGSERLIVMRYPDRSALYVELGNAELKAAIDFSWKKHLASTDISSP